MSDDAVFLESGWGILTALGVANVLYGLTIMGITHFSRIILILIIVSASGALANSLCYYAFYTGAPPGNSAAASATSDILWLVQEVGITLYGYILLMHLLSRRDRWIFMGLYWIIVVCIFVVRIFILLTRVQIVLNGDDSKQPLVNRLHTAYFSLLALLECICAFFLLRKFAAARKRSREAHLNVSLLQHLMRGTEIRVASLCLIGVSRAVTYFFQPSIVEVSTAASQIDRFVYALECAFPIMLYIDILASRIKFTNKEIRELPQLMLYKPPDGRDHSHSHEATVWHDERRAAPANIHQSRTSRRQHSASEQSLVEVTVPDPVRIQSPDGQGIVKTVQIDVYDSKV